MSENAMERSLMARNSKELLGGEYDLEPRGSAFFLYTESSQPFRASTRNVILCRFWRGGNLIDPLDC